ncbi:MAG: hypothetical protein ABFC90_05560 [Bacteroidales bacterium]|nr:hypothetical protein [Bacteroidales bacterium]MCK9311443.1 hypothetical protein [Bacteroidales bacterium]
MKTKIKYYLSALLLFVSIYGVSQVPAVSGAQCVECGAMNGSHKTWCKYYNSPTTSLSSSLFGVSTEQSIKMQLATSLASAFFSLLFNDNSQNNEQAIEQQRQQAALMAQRAAEEKRINDSIAQVKYEKMMQSYKRLNDANNLQFKSLSTSNMQFKSLESGSAPMTMEERERQNLKKRGIGITWDYNAWAQVPSNSYKMEETPYVPEANGPDKYLDDAINKIETFEGGRVAALAGRYMVGIKNNTISYLKDASDAAVSGNMAKMEETGQMDLRKLSSNALYEAGVKTVKANYENLKDNVMGGIQDKNFEVIHEGAKTLFPNYKTIIELTPKDWKERAINAIL